VEIEDLEGHARAGFHGVRADRGVYRSCLCGVFATSRAGRRRRIHQGQRLTHPSRQLLVVCLQRLVGMKILPIGGDPIGGNVFLRGD